MSIDEIATKGDIKAILDKLQKLPDIIKEHSPKKLAYTKSEACTVLNISPSQFDNLLRKGVISGGNYDNNPNSKKLYRAELIHGIVNKNLP